MKLCLTGATGFVGRNLLLRAIQTARYEKIYVPVRSRDKLRAQFLGDGFEGIPSQVIPIEGSARDWNLKSMESVDEVVHAAGTLFGRSLDEYLSVNVHGTLSLFSELGPRPRYIVLSSQAASGPCEGLQSEKAEGDLDAPVTWYGKSKLEMERRVEAEFREHHYLFLRPPMVLGPRDQATLPLFRMVKSPVHFKPGFQLKHYSFIAVSDLVSAIFQALDRHERWPQSGPRHYYVGSSTPITDRELIASTARAASRKGVMLNVPESLLRVVSRVVDVVPQLREKVPSLTRDRAREIWPRRWVVSSRRFQEAFEWLPQESLDSVLKETHRWYSSTGQI